MLQSKYTRRCAAGGVLPRLRHRPQKAKAKYLPCCATAAPARQETRPARRRISDDPAPDLRVRARKNPTVDATSQPAQIGRLSPTNKAASLPPRRMSATEIAHGWSTSRARLAYRPATLNPSSQGARTGPISAKRMLTTNAANAAATMGAGCVQFARATSCAAPA